MALPLIWQIKIPNADTEEWYLRSVNHTVDAFRETLHKLAADTNVSLALPNIDLDTGDHVKRGDYPLTDQTYAALLARITSRPDRIIPVDLERNILEYYAGLTTTTGHEQRLNAQLEVLKGMKAADGLTEP